MSRAEELQAERANQNRRYMAERAKLADRIAHICTETLKRRWKPPDRAGALWLADAVLAIRARASQRDFDPALARAISAGYGFIEALEKAGRAREAALASDLLVEVRGHRDPLLFLADQIKAVLAQTNAGNFPASPEKNGPLVKLTAALFDLTKLEPGQASLATVASILSGRRHKGAQ